MPSNLSQEFGPNSESLDAECLREIPAEYFLHRPLVLPLSGNTGPASLVCCLTTQGAISIVIYPSWAPLGTAHFLSMVRRGFLSSGVPLFRAIAGFLVQFGLSVDPAVQAAWDALGPIPDDPNWLPPHPAGGGGNGGAPRFKRGYVAFAGSGEHSRGTQLFIALADSDYLGAAPWEVPLGRLAGAASFATLARLHTGYGDAPDQARLRREGAAYLRGEFPLLDWIHSCVLVPPTVPHLAQPLA